MHLNRDEEENYNKKYSKDIIELTEMDTVKYCDKNVKTEVKEETFEVCKFSMNSGSELFVREEKLICILNRVLCTEC